MKKIVTMCSAECENESHTVMTVVCKPWEVCGWLPQLMFHVLITSPVCVSDFIPMILSQGSWHLGLITVKKINQMPSRMSSWWHEAVNVNWFSRNPQKSECLALNEIRSDDTCWVLIFERGSSSLSLDLKECILSCFHNPPLPPESVQV
jgi:hypothetical protein